MKHILVLFVLVCALVLLRPQTTSAVTIATVPVGNPGNANAVTSGGSHGSVAYNYSMGKYDVTVGQYTDFLNAVAATDTYGLYNPNMATDLNVAGIQQNGISGSYTYSVIGSPNHPITYVSWGDAARFANWLYNSQPGLTGPSVAEDGNSTEDGSYSLNGATTQAALIMVTRKSDATWVIPTLNESYKAAYYNPNTNLYFSDPFSSNITPISAKPGSTPNTGNFLSNGQAFAVTGSATYSSSQNYLTDVGAYTASASPYGAFDMGGDVHQWNETIINVSFRSIHGGDWGDLSGSLSFSNNSGFNPAIENSIIGFRVAFVPEPSTAVLASIGFWLLWALKKRSFYSAS
jgi:formylglycine-generating enzyme